ncbi:MAG: hypothetical protein ACYTGQ_03865, partial [Planctomycetota bacterium]
MDHTRLIKAITFIATLLALTGCSLSTAPAHPAVDASQTTPEATDAAVLGHLVSPEMTITIHAAPGGPVYSATDATGNTIASPQTRSELSDRHPAVH